MEWKRILQRIGFSFGQAEAVKRLRLMTSQMVNFYFLYLLTLYNSEKVKLNNAYGDFWSLSPLTLKTKIGSSKQTISKDSVSSFL